MYLVLSFLMVFMFSCQKDNYDVSETTTEEFTPEPNYTGADNLFSFALSKTISGGTSTTGGSGIENLITKEVLANGEIKWQLLSSITDGITITNEITFFTPNTDAGTFPIEELHFRRTDDTGSIIEDYTWTEEHIQGGEIIVSDLSDAPGIVSGETTDVIIIMTPDSLEFVYGANFSEIPIN